MKKKADITKELGYNSDYPLSHRLTADGYSGLKEKTVNGVMVVYKKQSNSFCKINITIDGREYYDLVDRHDNNYENYNGVSDYILNDFSKKVLLFDSIVKDVPEGVRPSFVLADLDIKDFTYNNIVIYVKDYISKRQVDSKNWLSKYGKLTKDIKVILKKNKKTIEQYNEAVIYHTNITVFNY